jgi:RNA polymerase sigma-70 factor (ECF subfamily)
LGVGARKATNGVESLVSLYDEALPRVYGYLVPRCGSAALAEDLTAETFMSALDTLERGASTAKPNVAWLIGVARHKLADHWRRTEREARGLRAVEAGEAEVDDPWPEVFDAYEVHSALATLTATHRIALTLRYLDGLPVAQVAECVGRSLHATETLLVRARGAFRRAYLEEHGHDA